MRHSNIFLSVTSAILAIAGVVAAKATNYFSNIGYYYTIHVGINCVSSSSFPCPWAGAGGVCKYTFKPGLVTWNETVYTAATFGSGQIPCINKLTYLP